jgi:hypothetical protein
MKELEELRDELIKERDFLNDSKGKGNLDSGARMAYADCVDKLTALIESGGEERQTEEDIYKCKKCAGSLARLDTSNGDPEGIRKDRICLNCGTVWGFTKADYYELESEENHKKPTDEEIEREGCKLCPV